MLGGKIPQKTGILQIKNIMIHTDFKSKFCLTDFIIHLKYQGFYDFLKT